ncbi:glycosyl transferase family 1 [Azospirillum thiophilum]|uniref:Glycosyl transferase family 1 n=1 Tax=Azospirillum thiophilum TaxID=528244 RepID=A0AAC8VVH7_9PROT|nr:FtsX-like permease family protein [Azospirillum thiophilum]ALG70279.1 glycosyl transferase family 1 [Azospirillum thiophilum]KJR66044.1 glycosyl transferase family 1 [Azospirillum thiophilum]
MTDLRLALRLARRELRTGLKGFQVFLACLALGVAAIAAVQSVSSGLLDGLANDGRSILGGDVALRQLYSPPTDEQMAALTAAGRVSTSAEMRAMARGTDEVRASLVELKAVDDVYPLYGTVTLQGGGDLKDALAKKDGHWGAVIEASLSDRLGVKPGDTIHVGEGAYRVAAVLDREPDRASSNAFSLGPRLLVALPSLEGTGLLQPGSLTWWSARVALPAATDLKTWQDNLRARFPDAPWRMRDFTNASPQIERFIDRMTLFLTLVGLTALLVGGVGVGNAVRSHLDSRARTIAMMKCIGAPGALVFQLYLAQILALALLGIVIGLALGAVAPLALGRLLDGVLPVSAQIGVYPGALALAALYGVLTALTFSLWPLGRAREVPAGALFRDVIAPAAGRPRTPYTVAMVLSALALAGLAVLTAHNKLFALWFVGGSIATFIAFRAAATLVTWGAARVGQGGLGRVRRPELRLALANLHRPGNPTGAVVLSLGLGLTVLVAIALIQGNFSRRVSETIPQDAPSFFFVDIQRDQFDPLRDLVTGIPGASNFEAVPSLRGRIESVNGQEAEKALVNPEQAWILAGDRGITYSATLPEHSTVTAGSWWPADYAGPPLISIHQSVADAFGIGPGATLLVNILGRSIEAKVANVRAADFTSMAINFTMVFAPGTLEGAPQTWIATVRATPEAEAQVQRGVLQRFPNITMVRVKDALDTVADMLGHIGTAVRIVAGITLAAGTLVLAGAVAAGHRRRVYDAVVLKVLGATRGDVLRAFLLEYGLLGLLTAIIAGGIGTLTAWAVLRFLMHWEWSFLPSAVVTTALLSTAITLAFGFYGTWRALGQPSAPLLRNE